jgi:hypothetical protein
MIEITIYYMADSFICLRTNGQVRFLTTTRLYDELKDIDLEIVNGVDIAL